MYAQVIIDANHAEVDRVFDYRVPAQWEEAVCVGLRVMVPFGQRNTKREGYVIALTETTEVPAGKIKEIVEILDEGRPILTPPILELAKWMKKEYFCTLNQCLQAVMPAGIRTKSVWYVELTEQTAELSEKEQQVADVLTEQGGAAPLRELEQVFGNRTEYILRCLQEKKVVRLRQKTTRSTYKKEKRYVSLTENEELLAEAREKAAKDKRLAVACVVRHLPGRKYFCGRIEGKSFCDRFSYPYPFAKGRFGGTAQTGKTGCVSIGGLHTYPAFLSHAGTGAGIGPFARRRTEGRETSHTASWSHREWQDRNLYAAY